jgi:hypothetical protein
VSFSKTSNSSRPSDSCYFEVFENLTRACYIQIALETMLLLINNLHKKTTFIHGETIWLQKEKLEKLFDLWWYRLIPLQTVACCGLWWRIITSIDCGGASSLAYVIIICNDVTRAGSDEIGQNLRSRRFLASLPMCDTIEGLRLVCYALLLGTEKSWNMSVFFDKFNGNIINLHRMWLLLIASAMIYPCK